MEATHHRASYEGIRGATWRIVSRGVPHYSERLRLRTQRFKCQTCARTSSLNGPGWSVRVVPNSRPRLRIEGELARRAEAVHDLMNGVGAHEIIVETSRHDRSLHELEIEEISNVIRAYIARIL